MIAFSRIMMTALFAGICFLLIVPLALRRHQLWLAIAAGAIFCVYLAANIVIWQRMNPRR